MSEQASADLDEELLAQSQCPDPQDELDLSLHYPPWLANGFYRNIELREGLELTLLDCRLCDRWEFAYAEQESWLSCHFHLSGEHQDACTEVGNLEYALYGSGLAPKGTTICPDRYHILEVYISMQSEVLMSFVGRNGELPPEFKHLICKPDQQYYTRVGTISPAMQRVLWQIVRCPYLGLAKRMYLEGKALEVAALVLEQECEVQRGRRALHNLEPDYVDRICRAREIVLQNLDRPLSLVELARQVELNDFLLKGGFRRVFGKTVFGYLRDYRLEQARQLLLSGKTSVAEVMRAVGFADRGYFAEAFRKRFGVNPKDYTKEPM
ncbi:helix-turn-helix transcriptional regulator [Gloeobacter violaceus]|nr:AraC family transcriptional regulator [Gloeobacter violaceus]